MDSTRRRTRRGGSGRRPTTGRGCRCRSCTGGGWRSPRPASSTDTAPTRSPSTRRSHRTGSRSSTAAWSSPWPTCAAAARWAGPGTRTGGWSTRPTPSVTSSPAPSIWWRRASPGPTRWPAGAVPPEGCSSARWPTQAPDLFAALVAQVPFVDVLTTMLDADLPLTVGEWEEWGNPLADRAAYDRMLSYSPYDNVSGTQSRWDGPHVPPPPGHRRTQ